MNRCKDCRFWNRNGEPLEICDKQNDYNSEPVAHRKCLFVIHGNAQGSGNHADREMENSPAAVLDGSGYVASLWTLPTFGCNAFEQKADE